MAITVAFDVYGTLIDTNGVIDVLQKYVGVGSVEFSELWRQKQLEYSFRRGLMQKYEPFSVCTLDALDYTCSYLNIKLDQNQRIELLNSYSSLPAFADVENGLLRMKKAGFRMYAYSNGQADAVDSLLVYANIRRFFLEVVSTDEIKSFKPNPEAYRHFLARAGSPGTNAWLVSSNPFDVIGAVSAGMQAAWVRRSPKEIFDPWGIKPTITLSSLAELAEGILGMTEKC